MFPLIALTLLFLGISYLVDFDLEMIGATFLYLGAVILTDFLLRTILCLIFAKFNIGKITLKYPPVKINLEPKDLARFTKTPYNIPRIQEIDCFDFTENSVVEAHFVTPISV
jgi:hypothetical protein